MAITQQSVTAAHAAEVSALSFILVSLFYAGTFQVLTLVVGFFVYLSSYGGFVFTVLLVGALMLLLSLYFMGIAAHFQSMPVSHLKMAAWVGFFLWCVVNLNASAVSLWY